MAWGRFYESEYADKMVNNGYRTFIKNGEVIKNEEIAFYKSITINSVTDRLLKPSGAAFLSSEEDGLILAHHYGIYQSDYKDNESGITTTNGIGFAGGTPTNVQNNSPYHSSCYPGQIIAGSGFMTQHWYDPKKETEQFPGENDEYLVGLGRYNNFSYLLATKFDSTLILKQTTPHVDQYNADAQPVHKYSPIALYKIKELIPEYAGDYNAPERIKLRYRYFNKQQFLYFTMQDISKMYVLRADLTNHEIELITSVFSSNIPGGFNNIKNLGFTGNGSEMFFISQDSRGYHLSTLGQDFSSYRMPVLTDEYEIIYTDAAAIDGKIWVMAFIQNYTNLQISNHLFKLDR